MEGYMNKLSWGNLAIIIGCTCLSIELYIPHLISGLSTFDFFRSESVRDSMMISKGLIIYGSLLVIIYFVQEYKKK